MTRWRLQLLADLGVGRRIREAAQAEEERYTHLKDVTHGNR